MQLSEKYRPRDWPSFIGQDRAIARLRAILGLESFDRGAFLLTRPSGSGKTSAANVIASELGCDLFWSVKEIKGQDCSIAELRSLVDWFALCAPGRPYRTVIINECHGMSSAAREYALELMENPPAERAIVLTTTKDDWADETLFSRFYRIRFAKPNADAVVAHLQAVCKAESLDVGRLNLKRFVQERHNNLRLCLMDLEIEAAVIGDVAEGQAA